MISQYTNSESAIEFKEISRGLTTGNFARNGVIGSVSTSKERYV